MGTDVEKARTPAPIRTPLGLLLSIGDTTTSRGGKEIPTKIDHFRPKPGQLEQYAEAAKQFHHIYGEEPKELTDVYFLSNAVPDVLEIKLVAFGKSGLRGVGATNYAALPQDEFLARAWSFEDDFTFFPREVSEVRPELRESWEGEPITGTLEGPEDKRVKKLDIRLIASLSFCLPRVMGIGKVAQISTGGRRSIKNLYTSCWSQWEFFRGRLAGPPFRLEVRPARTQRFDRDERKYVPVDFFELVLDTSLTVQQIYDEISRRNAALGTGDAPDRRALETALALPPPADEDVQLRDEPTLGLPDALLNRIAKLEEDAGEMAAVTLSGVFGVDSADELGEEDAQKYEAILEAHLNATALEGEVVEQKLDPDQERIDF